MTIYITFLMRSKPIRCNTQQEASRDLILKTKDFLWFLQKPQKVNKREHFNLFLMANYFHIRNSEFSFWLLPRCKSLTITQFYFF